MNYVCLDYGLTRETWIRSDNDWELVSSPDHEDIGNRMDNDNFQWYFEKFQRELIENPILKLSRSYTIQ